MLVVTMLRIVMLRFGGDPVCEGATKNPPRSADSFHYVPLTATLVPEIPFLSLATLVPEIPFLSLRYARKLISISFLKSTPKIRPNFCMEFRLRFARKNLAKQKRQSNRATVCARTDI